jgi:toxin-antitoxin system PIN domain toxin
VHAHRTESPAHRQALSTLGGLALGASLWGVPVFVIGEFLRVVTHPRAFQPPSTMSQAIDAVQHALASPTARILQPGPRYWELFQESLLEGGASGNLVFDAQIVAVCREHGVDTILTQDRDLRRFPSINVRRLS